MADNPFIQRRALGTEGYRPREVEVWGGGPQIIAGAVDIQPPHVEIERRRGVEGTPGETEGTGAFFRLLQKEVVGGIATFLQGGQVTGGDGNIFVDDIEVVDKDGDATSPDGHSLWLKIDGTAITADGVLMPGFNVAAALTEVNAPASIPDNIIPTAAAPDGTRYVLLGSWFDDTFVPSMPGNVQINHCPGSLSITRF